MADASGLTLLNPHADDFVATPLSFWLVGRRGLCKYKYLLDEPLRRGRRPSILVDGTLSSLLDQSAFNRLPRWLRAIILRAEIAAWLSKNGLTGRVDVHWSVETIPDRTSLYVFSYKNCVGAFERRRAVIASFKHAIVNLSHYFIRTQEKAENIAKLQNLSLTADSDLSRNEYFQKFFSSSLPLLVLPFAINERFAVRRPLMDRDSKCAATGTFHDLTKEEPHIYYRDFIKFFQTDTYHPVRKMLYQNREKILNWLSCRISPYRETSGNKLGGLEWSPLRRFNVAQGEYFSFDVADFYNEHRFAIVGEELTGAPAIGFFEAMACGCVMLGQSGSFYDGLGLVPNTHYLPHDGSIEGIRAAIDQANANVGRAAEISNAGLAYISEFCSPVKIWDALNLHLANRVDKVAARSEPGDGHHTNRLTS